MEIKPIHKLSDDVHKGLQEYLPFSPRDFIRNPKHFALADKNIYINELLRDIDEEHDFRFVDTSQENVIFAERLPWDSQFFGYDVARINGIFSYTQVPHKHLNYDIFLKYVLEKFQSAGVKYIFAPVFPENLPAMQSLGRSGFSLIETRVYHHGTLDNYDYERFDTRFATKEDLTSICASARLTVNPFDRFHADPFLSEHNVDRLMEKWVENSITNGYSDVTIVPNMDNPDAFVTVKYHQDKWDEWGYRLSQPIFGAVSPNTRGWYMKIISEVSQHLKSIGSQHIYLSSQITNRAVLHSWEKLGFKYGRGEHIFSKAL